MKLLSKFGVGLLGVLATASACASASDGAGDEPGPTPPTSRPGVDGGRAPTPPGAGRVDGGAAPDPGGDPAPDGGVAPDPACTDVPPDGKYTCAEQAGWGKCNEPWMQGFCLKSCGRCAPPSSPDPTPTPGAACQPTFASGVNLAWLSFAADVPNPRLDELRRVFTTVAASGGRVVRWWLHTNGAVTPGYDARGYAKPLPAGTLEDIRNVLKTAKDSGVQIVLSLWSFDMLQGGQSHPNATEASDIANGRALLTRDDARQAYIDNVLTPMVRGLGGHPALHSWEIFNEPEGMSSEFGWTPTRVGMVDIQKTVNWLADAIHREAPSARVTNGSWSFRASSDVAGNKNFYSDEELKRAGSRAKGTLDYYQVHYYEHAGPALSPFVHPASYWGLDKPIVIGEFWAQDSLDGVARDDMYTRLHAHKYAGAWAWQYYNTDGVGGGVTKDFRWPRMQRGIENLRAKAPADVEIRCR